MLHTKYYHVSIIIVCLLFVPLTIAAHNEETELTQYKLSANFNPMDRTVTGELVILWRNNSGEDISYIPLHFRGYDESPAKGMLKCLVNGQKVSFTEKIEKKNDLYTGIEIARPVKSGEKVKIEISFKHGKTGEQFSQIIYTGDWHPIIIKSVNGKLYPNRTSLAEFHLKIKYPKIFQIAQSGNIINESSEDDSIVLKTEARNIPHFGVIFSDKFETLKSETAGVKIISMFKPENNKWGEKLLEMSEDIVSFYKEEIGFYPQPVLYILPGFESKYTGGYPIAPNIIIIHMTMDTMGDYAETFANWITAHEIAHQYWGFGYILEPTDYPRWFGLSMGIYTDRIYSRARGLEVRRFREFKSHYMSGILAGLDTTIMQPVQKLTRAGFDWNNVIAHGKSFTVITLLENKIGKEKFNLVFRECLKRFKGKVVTIDMFQSLCEEISGMNLDDFFTQWYKENKYLDYRKGKIRIKPDNDIHLYSLDIENHGTATSEIIVELETIDGTKIRKKITGTKKTEQVQFKTKSFLKRIVLDPDELLPLMSRFEDEDTLILAVREMRNTGNFRNAHKVLKLFDALPEKTHIAWYYKGILLMQTGRFQKAVKSFEKVLEFDGGDNLELFKYVSYVNLGRMYDLMGERNKALEYYKICVKYDRYRKISEEYIQKPFDKF